MTQTLRRIAILAEGTLEFHHGKTAISLLRYRPQVVVAVIDSEHAGATTGAVLGLAGQTPIVQNLEQAAPSLPAQLHERR